MKNILTYLDNSARLWPDRPALADEDAALTFSELRGQVYAVAQLLASRGLPKRTPVGVYSQRRVETVIAMLGAAAAGLCYVPLNPLVPDEKNHKILLASGVKILIGCGFGEYKGEAEGCEYFHYDHNTLAPNQSRPPIEVTAADTLYIIYTSGSTGEPKGIAKSHGAIMDFIEAYTACFGFDEQEIIGNQTPFCFDASAKDIYLMLYTGACMHIIPAQLFSFPVKLVEYLNEKKISFVSWVPSALAIVARLRTFRDVLPTTLRRVFFVGEVFPVKDLEVWREALPDIDYVNLYGSSELSGICCYYRIPPHAPCPDPLPIGVPLSNSRIYLGEDGRVTGESSGEIMVASRALADGYIGDSEKTAAAYITLQTEQGPVRALRTGDWARYNDRGELVFMSRGDGLIKYKGYRIELGEVEAAVNALDYIRRACVLYDALRERITVFASSADPELKLKKLNDDLHERLADYMLPRRLVLMDELPLNANGKIDRPYLKTLF